MSRDDSPFTVGDFWLDKRRDGKAADIWQIASYRPGTRSTVYKSTKCRTVEEAIPVICAHEAAQRSKVKHQPKEAAQILPHLFNYLREQGPDVKRLDTVKSSFRAWIGFLMQDELTTGATVADVDKNMVNRFRRWRMGPHSWSIEWDGKTFDHSSDGVSAKTVMRNIEDLRAALHHAEANNRFEAPRVMSVDKKLIKKNPRQPLTIEQLGAIVGYASEDIGLYREVCLQIATGCRPGSAMKFDPAEQWHGATLDLLPDRADETDKRAAVVPVIDPLKPILKAWKEKPHDKVKSRKTTWRTMRRALGLPAWAEAYCIRTTVATYLDTEGTPLAQVSGILGHLKESRGGSKTTTEHYLVYDPLNCERAKQVLTQLFESVLRRSEAWLADHLRTTPVRGRPVQVIRRSAKIVQFRRK